MELSLILAVTTPSCGSIPNSSSIRYYLFSNLVCSSHLERHAAMLGLLLGHLYFVEVAIDLLCSADGIEVGTLDKMKKFKRVKLWQAMDDLHLLF